MARLKVALLGGRGTLAGSVGILSLVAFAIPAMGVSHHLKEALELYFYYIRGPLLSLLGLHEGWWLIAVDLAILWLSFFLALNVFIYQIDGTFIWEHVGRNYCFRAPQNTLTQMACRLPKIATAFLLGPLICIVAIYAAIRTGRSHLTMGFLTVDPVLISKFLLAIFAIPTLTLAIINMVLRVSSLS